MKPYSIYIHRKLPVIRVKTSVSEWTDTAKALLKESIERGEDAYDVRIYSHSGEYLGTNRDSDRITIFFDVDDEDKGENQ